MLTHPNVNKLLEVYDTPKCIFAVLQYEENGELLDYVLRKVILPEKETCKYFRQLVSAVAYCHQRRIVHRDLKLENILLSATYDAKIIDFGLSNILK